MKIHYFIWRYLFFLVVFVAFLLYPLMQNAPSQSLDFSSLKMLFSSGIQTICAILILFFGRTICSFSIFMNFRLKNNSDKNWKRNLLIFLKKTGAVSICLGTLFVISAILQAVALFFNNPQTEVSSPYGFYWIVCILNLLLSAFYEEAMYRVFVPECIFSFFYLEKSQPINKGMKITAFFVSEIFALIIFAFSHRYLGIVSVINAALGHIALRICLKKTGSIWTNCSAHFLYNLISLIFVTI